MVEGHALVGGRIERHICLCYRRPIGDDAAHQCRSSVSGVSGVTYVSASLVRRPRRTVAVARSLVLDPGLAACPGNANAGTRTQGDQRADEEQAHIRRER